MIVFSIAAQSAETENRLYVVKDGRAVCNIVIPKDANEWTNKAAQWLQEYIQKASGAELKIVSEEQSPAGTLISVGHTQLAQKAGISVNNLKWDGCKLVVRGNVLYLIGRDQAKELKTRSWVGARGTCRAVLTFLEDVCGVRWFLPTPKGEFVPPTRNISVPSNLSKTFTPAFACFDGRSVYNADIMGEPGGTPASIANNFRKAIIVAGGGHTYPHAVPAEKYFNDHPEYFALIDGKRTGNGNHLCTSNPDVKRLLMEWTKMRFDEGYEWQSIGQEDGYLSCKCPECEKLDDYRLDPSGAPYEVFMATILKDKPCERVFLLNKAVIDEVKKSHPDHKVVLMCYAPTAWPSKKIKHFGDNVVAEVMHPDPKYLDAWNGKTTGILTYVYWFNTQCPMGVNIHASPRELADRVRYMHQRGVIGFSCFPEANWGLQGPLFYMLGRLMGDPSQDDQNLIKEYCRGVYGKAGDRMLQFFNALYARVEEAVPVAETDIMLGGRNVELGLARTPTQVMLAMYPPQVLDQLERLLRQAEAEADTERAAGWVKLTRDQFDFIKLLTESLASYRDYQADAGKEKWLQVKANVEAFDACRTRILTYPKEHIDLWFPGHIEFCKYLSGGAIRETVSYYVPWEQRKAEVLKKGIKGVALGHGDSYYYSFFKEPLTLDFSKEPVFSTGK